MPPEDAERVAQAVGACPAVTGLSGGRLGDVATYLPGRRVPGVRVRPEAVEVHVVGRYGATMEEIAGQVREAAAPLVHGIPVDVVVEDLEPAAGGEA